MRLALSTALLVSGNGESPPEAIEPLIDGFSDLDLPVIPVRTSGSAFLEPLLEATLEERGILTLVLCGGAAEATARDALNLGFRVFVAGDAAAIAEVAAALDVLQRRRA